MCFIASTGNAIASLEELFLIKFYDRSEKLYALLSEATVLEFATLTSFSEF